MPTSTAPVSNLLHLSNSWISIRHQAIGFVRDSIVYQPYTGTLRGAAGTLRAGAGNSLDQSILLANLLKTAGLDARIARGTLTDADALRLLRNISQASPGSIAGLPASEP